MTFSPTVCTTKPIVGFMSFAAGAERLLILEANSPLASMTEEFRPIEHALARAVSRGAYVAMHAHCDDLSSGSRLTNELAHQALRLSDAVYAGRGGHVDRFRMYHRPPLPGQQRLFGKSDKKPTGPGWDMVIVSRSRKRDTTAVRGILMQRSTYGDIMEGVLRSTPVPETDPTYAHYLKMFRCVTSVKTRRFPLAKSWQPDDRIAEIDAEQLANALTRR